MSVSRSQVSVGRDRPASAFSGRDAGVGIPASALSRRCDGAGGGMHRRGNLSGEKQHCPEGPEEILRPTDVLAPDYFHKVVDCQWACPAHTPVPEYIRLIATGRPADAYMVNWRSNVFPGVLGRTCDRPCEPACRRGRVEERNTEKPEPVAICRLKRVAADYKDDIRARLPKPAQRRNGKRVACIGAGPASLTVARDLAPLGYHVTVF